MAMTVPFNPGYGGTGGSNSHPFPYIVASQGMGGPAGYPYGSEHQPNGSYGSETSSLHIAGTQGNGQEPCSDPRDEGRTMFCTNDVRPTNNSLMSTQSPPTPPPITKNDTPQRLTYLRFNSQLKYILK